jgi:hypothetical protein
LKIDFLSSWLPEAYDAFLFSALRCTPEQEGMVHLVRVQIFILLTYQYKTLLRTYLLEKNPKYPSWSTYEFLAMLKSYTLNAQEVCPSSSFLNFSVSKLTDPPTLIRPQFNKTWPGPSLTSWTPEAVSTFSAFSNATAQHTSLASPPPSPALPSFLPVLW